MISNFFPLLHLTDRFGDLNDPRNMRRLKTWFRDAVEAIDVVKSGTRYTAALPDVFQLTELRPIANMRRAYSAKMRGKSKHLYFVPNRIEAVADSRVECVGRLAEVLAASVRRNKGDIEIFTPKDGQDPNILVSGKTYFTIHHDDPLHDHDSADLIDFRYKRINPATLAIHDLSFDAQHVHLIDPKLL